MADPPAIPPTVLLAVLRFDFRADPEALALLNAGLAAPSPAELDALLGCGSSAGAVGRDVPAIARRLTTQWQARLTWIRRAAKQYKRLGTASKSGTAVAVNGTPHHGIRRWVGKLCALAAIGVPFHAVAANLGATSVSIMAALNYLADCELRRKRAEKASKLKVPPGGTSCDSARKTGYRTGYRK